MSERKIWLALAAVFAAGGVVQLPWAPSRFGGVFFLTLAAGCAGEWLMLRLQERYRVCRVLSVVGRVLFGLFVVSFVAVQGIILHGMRADPEAGDADYLLVLGARVYEDGRPSAALAARLDTAYDFLQAHPEATAILCGGQGSNEPCPEAEAMYDYLTARGMDADRLLLEDESNNTIQDRGGDERLPPCARPRADGARRTGRGRYPRADALSGAARGGALSGVLLHPGSDAHRQVAGRYGKGYAGRVRRRNRKGTCYV